MSQNVTKRLTPKQRKAIDALLAGAKQKDAALAANVTYRTLARWHQQEAFASELQRRSTAATKDAALRLTGGLDAMLDVLLEVAQDEDAPRHVRVRAATAWLDRQLKVVELADVLERLDRREEVVARS